MVLGEFFSSIHQLITHMSPEYQGRISSSRRQFVSLQVSINNTRAFITYNKLDLLSRTINLTWRSPAPRLPCGAILVIGFSLSICHLVAAAGAETAHHSLFWCVLGISSQLLGEYHPECMYGLGDARKELCREGPIYPGRQQVDHDPTVCPCGQEGQWCLGMQKDLGRSMWFSSPFTLCPVLGSSVQERQEICGESPAEGHEGD